MLKRSSDLIRAIRVGVEEDKEQPTQITLSIERFLHLPARGAKARQTMKTSETQLKPQTAGGLGMSCKQIERVRKQVKGSAKTRIIS